MSHQSAMEALHGGQLGFVCGMTWVSADALAALAYGTDAIGPADALATLARALELDFAFVPSHEPWAADAVAGLRAADVGSIWAVGGVLGRVGERVGWTEMLRMSVAEPGALAVYIGEALHEALDDVRAGARARADAAIIADDVAGATGPLVSPDFALDALVPCYRSLAREAERHGLIPIFHSDGDIRALYPALARAGFAGVHLAGLAEDAVAISFATAREEGLVVLGGIESATLLSGARRLGVHAGLLARTGGLLVCDDGGITSAEEVAALAGALEAARDAYARGI